MPIIPRNRLILTMFAIAVGAILLVLGGQNGDATTQTAGGALLVVAGGVLAVEKIAQSKKNRE